MSHPPSSWGVSPQTLTLAFALQDTYVANGANWKTNYGSATTLDVATSPVNQDHSSIAMLKFDLTQVPRCHNACAWVHALSVDAYRRMPPSHTLRSSARYRDACIM